MNSFEPAVTQLKDIQEGDIVWWTSSKTVTPLPSARTDFYLVIRAFWIEHGDNPFMCLDILSSASAEMSSVWLSLSSDICIAARKT